MKIGESLPPHIDVSTPHPARRYDYWLGGKDHFAADRASGDAIASAFPDIVTAARENRRFLQRAVRYLAGQRGIRQYLDIGTGLPTAENTHEIAQRHVRDARVVYVDNDPLVLVHARALLSPKPPAVTAYIDADLRHPDQILTAAELRDTLDLSQPTALMLVAVLHFVTDPDAAVEYLLHALCPGSFLVLTHGTYDLLDAGTIARLEQVDLGDFRPRTRQQVSRFFDGLELLPPGLQVVTDWHPEPGSSPPPPEAVSIYGAVACKP